MGVRRVMTVLGASVVAATIAATTAPGSAIATPGPPTGVTAVRLANDPHKIQVSWRSVKAAHHYDVSVFDDVSTQLRTVSATATTSVILEAPNNCSTYRIKVGARDAANLGGTTGYYAV